MKWLLGLGCKPYRSRAFLNIKRENPKRKLIKCTQYALLIVCAGSPGNTAIIFIENKTTTTVAAAESVWNILIWCCKGFLVHALVKEAQLCYNPRELCPCNGNFIEVLVSVLLLHLLVFCSLMLTSLMLSRFLFLVRNPSCVIFLFFFLCS